MVTNLVIMTVCVILSAYFSATETAFSSLNRTRLKALAENGNKKAAQALALAEDYDKLISTILIGNNIVNILLASIGTVVFVALCGDAGATISTVVITIVVLIFGEITPKSMAKDHAETWAMISAPFLKLLIRLLTPVNFLFTQWKKLIGSLFKSSEDAKMSQEELLLLLEEVQQEGSIDESEGELLRNAVEFGDLQAQDILTHRMDLEAVSIDDSKETIARAFTDSRYSRLLVYEGSVDHIVGVLHLKDFYIGTGVSDEPIQEMMTPPVYIHQTEKVDDLLQLLQSHKSHVAVVIDEYGGTQGIVTMEDILEELVGEIWDEHDEVEETFRKNLNGTYTVDCTVTFDDFCDFFGIKAESDSVSLGGWVMEQLGRIPVEGDRFEFENLSISVSKTDDRRTEEVIVTVKEPQIVEE